MRVETLDPAARRFGRGREERLELRPDGAQRRIVFQQGFVNFRQSFEDGGVGGQLLAHLHEGADDKDAHGDGFGAVQHRGRHDGAVLGEGVGAMSDIPFGCGRNL